MLQGLKMLRELKSVVIATVDENQPHSRIIDIMHADDNGLYFITLKSKPFCRQLNANMTSHLISETNMNICNKRRLFLIRNSLLAERTRRMSFGHQIHNSYFHNWRIYELACFSKVRYTQRPWCLIPLFEN